MKAVILFTICTLLSFSVFAWRWTAHELAPEGSREISNVSESKILEFFNTHAPLDRVELRQVFSFTKDESLKDSETLSTVLVDESEQALASLKNYHESCDSHKRPHQIESKYTKTLAYADALCHQSHLTEKFFSQQPYIHPSGNSYAYHYWKQNPETKPHLEYMHILEILREGTLVQKLPEGRQYFIRINASNIDRAMSEARLFVSVRYAFYSNDREGQLYKVYKKSDLSHHLHSNGLSIDFEKNSAFCDSTALEFCVGKRFEGEDSLLKSTAISTTAFLFLALISLFRLRRKEKQKLLHDEKLILQNLAHELRTPVTSLLLNLETFPGKDLSEAQTKKLQALDSDVQKLFQLTRTSQSFLRFQRDRDGKQETTSVKEILNHLRMKAGKGKVNVQVAPHFNDQLSIRGASEYVFICLDNLINNALEHGKGTIRVSLREQDSRIIIEIKDEGTLPEEVITFLSSGQPIPRDMIKNTGVGLQLVRAILKSLKGTISASQNPSTILLSFEVKA